MWNQFLTSTIQKIQSGEIKGRQLFLSQTKTLTHEISLPANVKADELVAAGNANSEKVVDAVNVELLQVAGLQELAQVKGISFKPVDATKVEIQMTVNFPNIFKAFGFIKAAFVKAGQLSAVADNAAVVPAILKLDTPAKVEQFLDVVLMVAPKKAQRRLAADVSVDLLFRVTGGGAVDLEEISNKMKGITAEKLTEEIKSAAKDAGVVLPEISVTALSAPEMIKGNDLPTDSAAQKVHWFALLVLLIRLAFVVEL